jgi:ferrous iron transport protein B
MIIALNQYDLLKERGYEINIPKLTEILQTPVIQTTAVHNRGVHEILEQCISIFNQKIRRINSKSVEDSQMFKFGREIEAKIQELTSFLDSLHLKTYFPSRFTIVKLLDGRINYQQYFYAISPMDQVALQTQIDTNKKELETYHGEQISTILNSEFFTITNQISEQVTLMVKATRSQYWKNLIDHLTLHSVWGYVILVSVILGIYTLIFSFGNWISEYCDLLYDQWTPEAILTLGEEESFLYHIVWVGMVGGLFIGIGGILPYIIPFYFFIELLQDSEYLPRAAYLMDNFMHKIGVHGKTIIPMILGFGCSVPAIAACSIMDSIEDKRRSILLTSMIPCSATMTIIMGLTAKYLGLAYALLLYCILIVAIIFIGKLISRNRTSEKTELIIELHDITMPDFKTTLQQTWKNSKDFVYLAIPLIIFMGSLLQILDYINILDLINIAMSPLIVYVLGLPIGVGIYFFYGILRKELNLVLLQIYVASIGITLSDYMNPIQMLIFTLFTMLYAPCLATMITIKKGSGRNFAYSLFFWKWGIAIIITAVIRWIYNGINYFWMAWNDFVKIGVSFVTFFIIIFMGFYIWNKHTNKQVKKP